eukprot:6172576-Pleurochrysis_carterae.AAC.1
MPADGPMPVRKKSETRECLVRSGLPASLRELASHDASANIFLDLPLPFGRSLPPPRPPCPTSLPLSLAERQEVIPARVVQDLIRSRNFVGTSLSPHVSSVINSKCRSHSAELTSFRLLTRAPTTATQVPETHARQPTTQADFRTSDS